MATKITILGDGAWGTALALILATDPTHQVVLWSARAENGQLLRERRENVHLLPGVPIPESIQLTTDIEEAVNGSALWVLAIPTLYVRTTLARIASSLGAACPVLSVVKGIENESFKRPTEIVLEMLGPRPIAVLSGPSHAEEVSRGLPTTVVVASQDWELARWIQQRFAREHFRVYTNQDLLGVELGGALKNIIGIAAGIGDGLGFGDNSKSALLTRGIVEIARFGVAHGAEHQTFFGLAGLGDLITTCFSRHGRNRRVGEKLAQGAKIEAIVANMRMIAEGVSTTRSVFMKAKSMGLEMPITNEVYHVMYDAKNPAHAVRDLMLRQSRSEQFI